MSAVLETSVRVSVPFHDVDPAGLAWHGNYFRYFELARCALLERFGYNYREMADSGLMWPVIDLSCRFTGAIRYHDEIDVHVRLAEWEYRMVFEYRILGADGKARASARTVHVPVGMDNGELVIGAEAFEARVRAALDEAGQADG